MLGDSSDREWPMKPYAALMRAVGQRLDQAGASNLYMLDVGTGLLVRYKRDSVERCISVVFDYNQLIGLDVELAEKRKPVLPPKGKNPPPPEQGSGYTDILRAIGARLDETRRILVSLDEQPEMFIMSYMFEDEDRAHFPTKGYLELPRDEVQEIRESDFAHRVLPERAPVWKRLLG
jgi:hypothetical protein